MAPPAFDSNFLQKSKSQGVADAFKPVDEGDYEMVCVESVIKPVKGMDPENPRYNWMLTFGFPDYATDELEEWGKRKLSTWVNLDEQNFVRIAAAYEALYEQEWPEEGFDPAEFADMVKNAKGRTCNVVVEVAPHYLAEQKPKEFGEAKQNNITSLYSPKLVEATDSDELFTSFS